jgi:hypothetical protein
MSDIQKAIQYWEKFRHECFEMLKGSENDKRTAEEQIPFCDTAIAALQDQAERERCCEYCDFSSGDVGAILNDCVESENKMHGLETIWETPDRCTYCGEHLAREWSYCPECGRPTEPEKPLTLEELRKMNNCPIWIVTGETSQYAIIYKITETCIFASSPKEEFTCCISGYGKTWFGYVREPMNE